MISTEYTAPIPPMTDEEMFISLDTLAGVVGADWGSRSTTMLWEAYLKNEGVHFADDGTLETITPGGLYCIRTVDSPALVSVDGLVTGILSNELLHCPIGFGPKQIAQTACLGLLFAPERAREIDNAISRLHKTTVRPRITSYLSKLVKGHCMPTVQSKAS